MLNEIYPWDFPMPEDPYKTDTVKKAAGGINLLSLIPSLGALNPLGIALSGLGGILGLFGQRSAAEEEEERRRKREALQRALVMSRSFEEAGRRWGY